MSADPPSSNPEQQEESQQQTGSQQPPPPRGSGRLYASFTLFMLTVVMLVFMALFLPRYFAQLEGIIKDHIWPAIISLLTMLGLVVAGVIRNAKKSVREFFEDPLAQIAVVVLFLSVLLLILFLIFKDQQSTLHVRRKSGRNFQINAELRHHGSDSITRILVPITLPLSQGTYDIRVTEPGYFGSVTMKEVGVWSNDTVDIQDRKLEMSIKIRADKALPADIKIFMTFEPDDQDLRAIRDSLVRLPLDIGFKKSGSLRIRLEDPRFQIWPGPDDEGSFEVDPEKDNLTIKIPLIQAPGYLTLRIPGGATALIDGQELSDRFDSIALEPGKHTLEVKKDGFAPKVQSLSITRGQHVRLTINLTRLCRVTFQPVRTQTEWTINGITGKGDDTISIPEGTYTVTFKTGNMSPSTHRVKIKKGTTQVIDLVCVIDMQ